MASTLIAQALKYVPIANLGQKIIKASAGSVAQKLPKAEKIILQQGRKLLQDAKNPNFLWGETPKGIASGVALGLTNWHPSEEADWREKGKYWSANTALSFATGLIVKNLSLNGIKRFNAALSSQKYQKLLQRLGKLINQF